MYFKYIRFLLGIALTNGWFWMLKMTVVKNQSAERGSNFFRLSFHHVIQFVPRNCKDIGGVVMWLSGSSVRTQRMWEISWKAVVHKTIGYMLSCVLSSEPAHFSMKLLSLSYVPDAMFVQKHHKVSSTRSKLKLLKRQMLKNWKIYNALHRTTGKVLE